MSWYEYELHRLRETQKFLNRIILGLAVFGSLVVDWGAVVTTQYNLDLMEGHPYPERILIFTGLIVGLCILVNILTIILFIKYRREKNGNV